MPQVLKPTQRAAGMRTFRCEGRRYKIQRESLVRDGGTGMWEIAIWDNDNSTWLLSSGETPEGQFKTLKQAFGALEKFIAKRPVPKW